MTPRAELATLEAERSRACRLTPDRALRDIDEAAAWVRERGIVTITPDCALPSLFLACHEPPYKPGSRGFGLWPRTKYPWAVELTTHPGIHGLKIHRGKRVLVSDEVAAVLDPLCRAAVEAAAGSPLIAHLRAAGPSLVEELQDELDLSAAEVRRLRAPLEARGAIAARFVTVPTRMGGHRHTSELRLWPPRESPAPVTDGSVDAALEELVVAGVQAAVLAPEDETHRWFSWPVPRGTIQHLVEGGRLARPGSGWVAT